MVSVVFAADDECWDHWDFDGISIITTMARIILFAVGTMISIWK
jgi:hypothetical protein